MTRRRRGQGPTISLFSFQDIITSVTAILILITLLLALELLDRNAQRSDPSPDHLAAELRTAIEEARREQQLLLERSHTNETTMRRLVEVSPASLRREAEQANQLADRTERRIQSLEAQVRDADQRQTRIDAERFDRRASDDELATIETEIDDLERRSKADRQGDRVYFRSGRGDDLGGWIVVVSGDQVAAAPLGREARPVVFDRANPTLLGINLSDAPVRDFLEWADVHKHEYLLVLVKPSGVGRFDAIEEVLQSSGRRFGFDLIGERQQVLDPERGVFRE